MSEQELEAIRAIFGNDYSWRVHQIQRPWQSPLQTRIHSIKIRAREVSRASAGADSTSQLVLLQDLVSLDLEWSYPEDYPNQEGPLTVNITNTRGLGPGHLSELEQSVTNLLESLVGTECIYEVVDHIADFITENNGIILPSAMSAHDLMQSRQRGAMKEMESDKSARKREEEAMEEKVQQQMAEKVKLEISKKQLLKKDEKERRKQKESLDEQGRTASSTRTFSECTITPIVKGKTAEQHTCLAWYNNDPSKTYLVSQFQFQIGHEEEIEAQMTFFKNFRHSNTPIVYDWEIVVSSNHSVLRILTNDFQHIAAKDVLKLGETISIANANAVLSSFLSVAEDMENEVLFVDLEDIWFDADGNPVFSSIIIPSILKAKRGFTASEKYPKWSSLPQTPACQIGILLLEMIAGDLSSFSSPLDCAAKMHKLNRDLGDFVQLFLEPNTKFNDLKGHPFFHSENQLFPKLDLATSSISSQALIPLLNTPKDLSTVSRYRSDFEEIEFLGRGGFGSVCKVRNVVDGRLYAVKKIKLNPLDNDASKRLIREVQTLSRLQSEFIVRYYQAWFEEVSAADETFGYRGSGESVSFSEDYSDDESDSVLSDGYESDDWLSSNPRLNHTPKIMRVRRRSNAPSTSPVSTVYTQVLYIQMEYCEKKTLRDVIDAGLGIEQAWMYLRQLLEGLGHLHESGVIHRDFKPSNIFLDTEKRVKIGDFGLATAKKDTSKNSQLSINGLAVTGSGSAADSNMTSEVGTPVYIAPEIMSGIGRYNSKVDIYSLGVVFFEMIYQMKTTMQRMQTLRELRKESIVFPADFDHEGLEDAATIIKQTLDHNPRNRPSCTQLLQSPLLPASLEDEYINEDLLRIVKQRNPSYFNRLVSTMFQQVTDLHKDFAYDYNGNLIFNSTTSLVASIVHIHAMRVFRRHSAIQITCPIVLPKSLFTAEIYNSKKTATFLDTNGDVVELPHDLTFPFARSLAQSNEGGITFPIKRFTIDKVFRHNIAGGQPRFVEEADFDIVYENVSGSNDMMPEAEVLKVALEILEFGQIHRFHNLGDYQIRVNYTQTLFSVLSSAGVPETLSASVLDNLSQLKKPLSIGQLKQNLLKIGLSKEAVEKITSFDVSVPITSKTEYSVLNALVSPECAQELIALASNLEMLGVTNQLSLDPLFAYNQAIFKGLFFQICKRSTQSKLDVIAAGGRYESLIERIRSPFINRKDLNAVGINFALSKFISGIAAVQTQQSSSTTFSHTDDSRHLNPCRKADVILISMGSNSVLNSIKMSIAQEIWTAGLSLDVSYHTPLSNLDDINRFRPDYSAAIVLKPKGADSYLIKVRNLSTKTEVEVQRSGIISAIQGALQRQFQKSGTHQSFESDTDVVGTSSPLISNSAKALEVVIVPSSISSGGKKKRTGKQQTTELNWILTEKSNLSTIAVYQKSKVVVVDIGWSDICKLSLFWQQKADMNPVDFDALLKRVGRVDVAKDYLIAVKKQIIKFVTSANADDAIYLIWIYSASDQKSFPLSVV